MCCFIILWKMIDSALKENEIRGNYQHGMAPHAFCVGGKGILDYRPSHSILLYYFFIEKTKKVICHKEISLLIFFLTLKKRSCEGDDLSCRPEKKLVTVHKTEEQRSNFLYADLYNLQKHT
ncbi:hypothetical protein S245_068186 [Arachis hypogaea]